MGAPLYRVGECLAKRGIPTRSDFVFIHAYNGNRKGNWPIMNLPETIIQSWRQQGRLPLLKLRAQLRGVQQLLLLGTALEVGIFAALDNRTLSPSELASSLGLDGRAVWTMAEALVEAGYLTKTGDVYSLTARSKNLFTCPSSPTYVADSLMHAYHLVGRWLSLPQILREGQPPVWKVLPPAEEHSASVLGKWAKTRAPTVVKKCLSRAPAAKTVLDLGGGQGIYAREFARSGLSVTLLDFPEVIEKVASDLAGVQRITLVGGDFQESLPRGPFDIVFLGDICHIYGPRENITLFSRVRSTLSPKGLLAILDLVRDLNPRGAIFGLTMLVDSRSGSTWTEAEYKRWLTQSGFCGIEIHHIHGRGRQLILAEKDVV